MADAEARRLLAECRLLRGAWRDLRAVDLATGGTP